MDQHTDRLTGLISYKAFRSLLDWYLLHRSEGLALLVIDLFGLRHINAERGHAAGDEILKQVARALLPGNQERAVSRLGGDVFLLLAPGLEGEAQATILARELLSAIQSVGEEQAVLLGANIGISRFPQDARRSSELISRAEQALAFAQRLREPLIHFEKGMEEHRNRTRLIIHLLNQCIQKGNLELAFQPQQSLKTGQTTGAEVLIRMPAESGQAFAPDEFVPIAEESGLIRPLTEWILKETIRIHSLARECGITLPMLSVNLSPRNLSQEGFGRFVAEVFPALPARSIAFEITETSIFEKTSVVSQNLAFFARLGIPIILDDFGTGYSSFLHLRQLPLRKLKIDRSFITDILSSPADRAVVEAMIGLARALGLSVIAEGVETESQRELLSSLGCEEIQGYLYAKPLPMADFFAFIRGG